MSNSYNLGLPFIENSQAQKHVTYNEAIRMIDTLVNARVIDRDLATPPVTPAQGDTYVVATLAIGEWSGHDNKLAAFQDGAWSFQKVNAGFVVWVQDEAVLTVWDGANWLDYAPAAGLTETVNQFGINAIPDTIDKLAVSTPAVLFDNDGTDIRQKLNKNTIGDTASVLFQTGYSARAEFGLTGDDDFHVKTSGDGAAFSDAMKIDSATGIIRTAQRPVFSCIGNTVSGANVPLKFFSVTTNNGGHFDNATGEFTAPVDGLYQFSFNLATDPSYAGNVHIRLYKNGSTFGGSVASVTTSNGDYDYACGHMVIALVAGDTIDVRSTKANVLFIATSDRTSTFCGFLIA